MACAVLLIVNPAAGGGKAARVAPQAQAALSGYGLTVRRVDTRDLDHAREIALAAAARGETVVVLGGDGLIGVVADVLRAVPGALLGVLPGGRGNDLARVLGIPDDPVQACATIAHGVARAVDLGAVAGAGEHGAAQAFVGIASAGFDSDANRIANEASPRLGGLVYAYGALRALLSWRPARFEIELDPPGETRTFSGYSVAVANSKAYGGGMLLAPEALLDDGLLDVVVTERVSKLRFLANLPKVFKGTHVRLPSVRVFRAAEVEVRSERPFTMYADGDPIGELPVRVRALPAAVRMLVPPQSATGSAFGAPPPPAVQPSQAAAPAAPAPPAGGSLTSA
ncbi:MAG: diacylglycerol kinase family protein [Solirubrobacteraceae bacterium]|jgi:YegS/Rv2252/BmrU family lipid kinase